MKLVANSEDGHRREYIQIFSRVLCERGWKLSVDKLNVIQDLAARDPLLILMLEERAVVHIAVMYIRALMGRRTTALLFRGRELVSPSGFRHKVKAALLVGLRSLGRARVLTIVPFAVDPRLSRVAKGWIYDPQLWDTLYLAHADPDPGVAVSVLAQARGRRVVVALGAQSGEKGSIFLRDIWKRSPELATDILLVVAGRFGPGLDDLAAELSGLGAAVINRHLSDGEIRAFYGGAAAVWACYSPEYDQASGIFGRAVQFGLPVFVREQSYLSRLDLGGQRSVVALKWGDELDAARKIASCVRRPRDEPPNLLTFMVESRNAIEVALTGERH